MDKCSIEKAYNNMWEPIEPNTIVHADVPTDPKVEVYDILWVSRKKQKVRDTYHSEYHIEVFNKLKQEVIRHSKECRMCRGETTPCRNREWYEWWRECIGACRNPEGQGLPVQLRVITDKEVEEEYNRHRAHYNYIYWDYQY